MSIKKSIVCFLFFISFSIYAQYDFEYMGVIIIDESSLISYKISFNENNGAIDGRSLTDFGGGHETLSYISGYFDDDKNVLEFYESGIIYTKSFVNQNDFCFVNFTGELKRLNQRQQIEGGFKGYYSDGKECISGEIKLSNFGKILKRAKKLDKKIERSILISQEKKDKVNLVKELDILNTNRLNKNETLSIFTKGNKINLTIYDAGQEDGDKISLQVNGTYLFESLEATSKKKTIEIPLTQDQTQIKITALNNGSIGGNTVMLIIKDVDNTIETVTNLKKGENSNFVFLKKK